MNRNIKLLAYFNFLTDLIFYAPVAIIYFARVSGSYALGMSVFSTVFISAAVFEIPTGIFSDRIGRKNTVILGSVANLIGFVFYALGIGYLYLIIGAIFEGLARSFFSGNNDALLHDWLKENDRENEFHIYLGKLSSLFQIAAAVSALIGGIVAYRSFAWVMWISVIPKFLMVTVSLSLSDPHIISEKSSNIFSHLKESLRQFQTNQKLRLLTITSALRFGIGESAYLFRSVFVSLLWPLWAIGISNMMSNIFAATSSFFSGKLIDRFKPQNILRFEIIFNRLINLTALFFPSVFSPALMTTTSLTYGVSQITTDTLLQKEFTQAQRATLGSLTSLFGSLLFGVFAIFLGKIGDVYGPVKALIIANLLLLTPLLFYSKVFKSNE